MQDQHLEHLSAPGRRIGLGLLLFGLGGLILTIVGLPRPKAPVSPPAAVVDFTSPGQAVDETEGLVQAQVVLSLVQAQDVSVPIALSGTAAEGSDFTLAPNPVVIPAGQTTATIDVTLVDDALFEGAETIYLDLQDPGNVGVGSITRHAIGVNDDEAPPSVSFLAAQSTYFEDAGLVSVPLEISSAVGIDVTVPFQVGGTAKDPQDYSVSPGPVTIPAGTTQADLLVDIVDDAKLEPNETVVLVLHGPQNATLGAQPSHTVRIRNDDGPATLGGSRKQPVAQAVDVVPAWLDFGLHRVGETSVTQSVVVTNATGGPVVITKALIVGGEASDFSFSSAQPFPFSLSNGQSAILDVQFTPTDRGPRESRLYMRQSPQPPGRIGPRLTGMAIGATGAEILVNVGGTELGLASGELANEDYGFGPGGSIVGHPGPVTGTSDSTLYESLRVGSTFAYAFDLPNGAYDVTLHFVETIAFGPATNVFDVVAEGAVELDDLDVFTLAGSLAAHVETFRVDVNDGRLDLDFVASLGSAALAGLEVRSVGLLDVQPTVLDFGILDVGQSSTLNLVLSNEGLHDSTIETLRIQNTKGDGSDVSLVLGGQTYTGDVFNKVFSPGHPLGPGTTEVVPVTYQPTEHAWNEITLAFEGSFGSQSVDLTAISGFAGDPYLHPVLLVADVHVDYDGDGLADVLLDGSDSHTHEPGHGLTGWEWRENGSLLSTNEVDVHGFAVGAHTVELAIFDDNVPPNTLADTTDFVVVPVSSIPGVLSQHYAAPSGGTASDLLDAVPGTADFAETLNALFVDGQSGVGGSTSTGDVLVVLHANVDVVTSEPWSFVQLGGVGQRLFFDGAPVVGPVTPTVGTHSIEARFAVDSLADLPLSVEVSKNGQPATPLVAASLTHDQSALAPVINSMPATGTVLGGNQIVLDGLGFFPQSAVTVHWGATDLVASDFTSWSAERIELLSPPGTGTVQVSVTTPAGTSNVHTFDYQQNGPVPITFTQTSTVGMSQPTASAWGPDGRLYVVNRLGRVNAITFDDTYGIMAVDTYDGVLGLPNGEAMGIAFDPFDTSGPIRLYVAHTEMYAQGGGAFSGPAPYPGQISRLTGPDFDSPEPIVTNLPTSNHDHGVNGMVFDHNGDLLVCVGGNTNAGITHWKMGDLPETPLSGAIVEARLSRPDFSGALSYVETATGTPNADQRMGAEVDVAPGTHVDVYAAGLRNSFDLCLTTSGRIYATDNGPNGGFGPASTSASTQTGSHPYGPDELLLIEYGGYCGHPNRSRGRYDPLQNVFYNVNAAPTWGLSSPLVTLSSSVDGLCEYRSTTFGDQLRGDLIAQKFEDAPRWIQLGPEGTTVTAVSTLAVATNGLGVTTGPGGALVVTDYSGNKLRVFEPVDLAVDGTAVYEITPWRAPRSSQRSFVVGGAGFGSLADTTVTVGGIAATIGSVSPTRIHGTLPVGPAGAAGLVDVVVSTGGVTQTLTDAFQWLEDQPGLSPGSWKSGPTLPLPLGEVACGVVDGVLYVVGEGNDKTYAYDLLTESWATNRAKRPYAGHHHGAEVVGGRWYLIGGLGSGAGKVQIYDPQLDAWSLGADLPWSGGSVATAAIDGRIHACGGIVGSTTKDFLAVYDPTLDTWTSLASMPAGQGRNHAAAGTDGSKLYVFGGRGLGSGPGNWVANGFADVQIYDPATDTWETSLDAGSTLAPMPIGRGGTGRAVFYQGEFYVMGGETLSGPGAEPGNVYSRVDVYDPATNTWRLEAPLPTARHGIYPVVERGRILVAGGGTNAGFSSSAAFEVFRRP